MKTAMQELIDELKKLSEDRNADKIGIKNYMEKQSDIIDKSLEKEKEQIKDAWDAGMSEGIGTMMADLDWDGEFVNYYKETYGE